jgi:hypothetical protein
MYGALDPRQMVYSMECLLALLPWTTSDQSKKMVNTLQPS